MSDKRGFSRTLSRTLAIGAGVALVGGACAGSETGNGGASKRVKRPVSVEMRLDAPTDRLSAFDRDGFELAIESAIVSVERLEFVLPGGEECRGLPSIQAPYAAGCDEGGDRVRIEGPWTVDLVTGELEPVLEGIEVLDGVFEGIEMRLAPGEAGRGGVEEGDVLDGASFDVTGQIAVPRGVAPFGLTLDLNAQGRFGGGAAVIIGEDSSVVMLSFDIGDWFSDLALGACIEAGYVPSEAGVLRLERADRQACGDVSRAIRQALTDSGKVKIVPKETPPQANNAR